jgi:hypothetical protein
MNVVLVMDAFRIFFKFHHWNGDGLDEKGQPTKTTTTNNTPTTKPKTTPPNQPHKATKKTKHYKL